MHQPPQQSTRAAGGAGTRGSGGEGLPPGQAARIQREDGGVIMLRQVVSTARTLAGADGAAILLYNREHRHFAPATPGVAEGLDERWLQRQGLEAAQSLAAQAAAAHAVVDLTDTSHLQASLPLLAGGIRPVSACAVPLEANKALVGAVELFFAGPRDPVQSGILLSFASLAGIAITAARGLERERGLCARLETLDAATAALASDLDPEHVLLRLVEIAANLAGARYAALGVVGDDGYLSDFIVTGLTAEERERIGPLPRGHGLLGAHIREGKPQRVPAIGRDPRRVGFPPNHPAMTSFLGVPIRAHSRVVGDLYLTDKIEASEFTEDDQRLVELLAVHAGVIIVNARLHEQEGQARHTLQSALDGMRQQAATLGQQAELIDLAHDAIIVRDTANRVVQWNQGATATYGWSAPEAVGRVTHALLGTACQLPQQDIERTLASLGAWEGELQHARRDGTRIVVESRQALVRDAGGAPLVVLEINRDITLRKQAEERLRVLAELGTALVSPLDTRGLAATVAEHLTRGVAEWCAVLLYDDGMLRREAVAAHEDKAGRLSAAPRIVLPPEMWKVLNEAGDGLIRVRLTVLEAQSAADWLGAAAGPDTLTSWILAPIRAHGKVLGAISLSAAGSGRRFTQKDLELAQEVAARAALAVTNARLYAEVFALTQHRERERIGRDLHDGIIQDIYAASLQLENAAEDIAGSGTRQQVIAVADSLGHVIGDIRTYIRGLRSRELTGRALSDGLAALVEEANGRGGVPVRCSLEGTTYPLPDAAANTLLQITREALSNAVKHGHARAADVTLRFEADNVILTVVDDGVGFDSTAAQGEEHRGLRNLRARAEEAGGSFELTSAAGGGTRITVRIPAPS